MTRSRSAVSPWPAPAETAAVLAAATGVPAGLLAQLRDINQEQWRLEDISRTATTSDEIAAAKRAIDASNARRHHVISSIDQHVEAQVTEGLASAWYSETVGELCDRLLILDLKHQALRRDAAAGCRLAEAERACQHLAQVAVRMVDDIQAGRAALPPRVGVKIYSTSATPSTAPRPASAPGAPA